MTRRINPPLAALAAAGILVVALGIGVLASAVGDYLARPVALGAASDNLDFFDEAEATLMHDPSLNDNVREQLVRNLVAQESFEQRGNTVVSAAVPYSPPRFDLATSIIVVGLALLVGATAIKAALASSAAERKRATDVR